MRISLAGCSSCTFFFLSLFSSECATDEFVEELVFKRVAPTTLLAQLNFKYSERVLDSSFVKFSPVLYSLFNANHVRQLEFSISQGFWRNSLYGQPPEFGGAPGVYVVAHFDPLLSSVETQWPILVQQLNGLFCSSFAVIGESMSSPLVFSKVAYSNPGNESIVYGAFTGDNICTENAESFKKLLPCQRLGLCELLNNFAELYESLFYSMAFSASLRNGVWSSHVQANILKPITSKQVSMFSIFRQKITAVCPVATKSLFVLEESTKRVIDLRRTTIDLASSSLGLNVSKSTFGVNLIEFSSFLRETFLVRGKFISTIKSTASTPTRAVFVHLLPWQLHLWPSTTQFNCNGRDRKTQLRFSSKHTRTSPILIEIVIEIPPDSICTISYEFQKGFLRFDEYPPDSSSGIHVPGPILSILPGQWSESTARLHGEPTIVLLPIPDFSMPFNVICFVCTIVALFFQLMLTFTTKYPSTVERESKGVVSWIGRKLKIVYQKYNKPKTE